MKAFLPSAVAALCIVACSQQSVPPPAHIVGTDSLVAVNDLLFVTSPGAAELRALDLKISPRDFVRAPNPLEPLAIPVLDTPAILARDIDYNADGDIDDTTYNPNVYVQGAASSEISIVGTRRNKQLVELKRLVAASGIVTAIAARAPAGGDPTKPSTLYIGTWNGTQGNLWRQSIPPADPTTGVLSANLAPPTMLAYAAGSSTVGEPISSIAVLPNNRLAVASRTPGSAVGRAIILDTSRPDDPHPAQWVLDFPSPVRQLATHPAIYRSDPNGPDGVSLVMPAGARIFGVLDEDACAPSADCTGILAVDGLDTSPRFTMRSIDASGAPMVPIRLGPGLTSALTLAPTLSRKKPGVALAISAGGTPLTFDQLGVVTTSNGLIYFFDARELSVIDLGTGPQASSLVYLDAAGNALASCSTSILCTGTYVPGPQLGPAITGTPFPGIRVALGAAVDEFVSVTYQGVIPGFRDLPTSAPSGTTQLPYGTADITRLRSGADRIIVTGSDGCSAEVQLSRIDTDPARHLLIPDASIPCTGTATFSVRAGGDRPGDLPYVVEGTITGYMGRTANNRDFAFPTTPGESYRRYYFHPPPDPANPSTNFDPTNPQPQIQFSMGPGDSAIQRDWRYLIKVDSNYMPEFVQVDISLGIEFHTPGASSFVGALPDGTDVSRLYVAYPSANAILEFSPQLLYPNQPNARNIAAFR
jgi:hypothetical protein